MDNPRAEKVAVVDEVRSASRRADGAVAHRVPGSDRRRAGRAAPQLTAAGGDYKIYKNTLVRLAVAGGDHEGRRVTCSPARPPSPSCTATSSAVAKALRDFARTNPNLVVKGGVVGSGRALGRRTSRPWPTCRPREVLLAQSGRGPGGAAPAARRPAPGPAPNLAYGLSALIEQRRGRRRGLAAAGRRAPDGRARRAPSRRGRRRHRQPQATDAEPAEAATGGGRLGGRPNRARRAPRRPPKPAADEDEADAAE